MKHEPMVRPVEDMQNYDFLCYPQNQRLHFDLQQAVSARHDTRQHHAYQPSLRQYGQASVRIHGTLMPALVHGNVKKSQRGAYLQRHLI